ncbi:MAG TPA: ethanolamine ammonia-lyase subunit EutC [Gemmataceae bacterium]|nr:ethanolamine ammonia-lyase subunit EutC [Gemmataceae bacterium]
MAHEVPVPNEPVDGLPEIIRRARARTPARILVGRAGPAYRTATQLELRSDHAAAVDAVHAEIDLGRDFPTDFVRQWRLFQVRTSAHNKTEYLLRPDLGRRLSEAARQGIARQCQAGCDVQVVIGDGLSAAAVKTQVPGLLPLLVQGTQSCGRSFGRPFVVQYCRVGILNDIGEVLDPRVVILLIGERPGLATADSLSAYLAYRPRAGHTDAQRNLISNIHARGIGLDEAAARILRLADQMVRLQASGVMVKEDVTTALPGGCHGPAASIK